MNFKPRTLQGFTGRFVRFDYESPTRSEAFSIYAYDSGIELLGQSPRIKTEAELEGLAKAISTAWQQHLVLKGE